MALSETGKWLEEALLRLSSDGDSALDLDSETLYSLVSYCEMAPPADASEYLLNIVGNDRSKDIVAEYLRRRGGTNTVPNVGMQAYHKPRDEESWSTGSKRPPKLKSGAGEGSGISPSAQKDLDHNTKPLYSGNGVLSAENIVQKGKRLGGKGKKGGKGVSLAEASKGLVVFARNGPCNCQCTRHNLVNNCLSCGRIVCEQEGEGPCHFCGVLVLKEDSDYGGLEGLQVPPSTEAEVAAEEFKNRLVQYDRTAASRTTVIDDQSDYFEIEGNTWLTEQEKKLLIKRQEDEQRIAEERRKRVVVTIDLLGRKVVMAGQDDGKESGENISILGSEMFVSKEPPKVSRVTPNPYLAESPVYIDMPQSTVRGGSGASSEGRLLSSSRKGTGLLKSGRIQHEDPLVEALIGHKLDLGVNGGEMLNVWRGPKARASRGDREEEEFFFDCRSETAVLQELGTNASTSERTQAKEKTAIIHTKERTSQEKAFDICLSRGTGKQKPVVLSQSILLQKQMERKEALNETQGKNKQPNKVLLPGMVVLKKWLSPDQQVDIVKHIRTVGLGPGGFYNPKYGDNAKMHLQMMCLGIQWEPPSRSYAPRRAHHDNALPPPIPESFIRLVDKALLAARVAASEVSGGKSVRVVLDKHSTVPDMDPNVCVVNFYEHTGHLGMHQDKDESPESLQKELPVVSFSIGDSAEFIFGNRLDIPEPEKVTLESGDVLIFGGPARMIYHGVTQVIADSCPKWLSQKTNLRPGRLNLTFRQY